MQKVAFKMKLKPGYKEEYKKRHDEIWDELILALKNAGIDEYSIYLDEDTGILFAIQKLKENHNIDDLSKNRIMKKWWDHMADIMEVKPDNSPVFVVLEQMFYMD